MTRPVASGPVQIGLITDPHIQGGGRPDFIRRGLDWMLASETHGADRVRARRGQPRHGDPDGRGLRADPT